MANPITNKVKIGQTPVIKKDLEGGTLGEANNDGTIFVDNSVKEGTPLYKEVVVHEETHLGQMNLLPGQPKTSKPDLEYDDNSVTWKGKKYLRKNGKIIDPKTGKGHPEGSMKFAWEKEADKAGKKARKEGNKNNNDDMNYNKNSSMNMNAASPITKKAKGYGSPLPKKKKPNKKGKNNQQQDLNTFYSPQDFMAGQGTGLSYNYQSKFPFSRAANYENNNIDQPSTTNVGKNKFSTEKIDGIAPGRGTGLSYSYKPKFPFSGSESYGDKNVDQPSTVNVEKNKFSSEKIDGLAPGQGTGLAYDYGAGLPLGIEAGSIASDPDKPTIISKPPSISSKKFGGFDIPKVKPMIGKPIEIFNDNIEIDQGELEETGETFDVSKITSKNNSSKTPKTSGKDNPATETATSNSSKTSNTSREGQYLTGYLESRNKAAASRVQEREGRRNIRQARRAIDKYNRMPKDRKPIDPRTMKPFASPEEYARYKVRQADFTNPSSKRIPTSKPKDEDQGSSDQNKGGGSTSVNTGGNGVTTSGTAQADFLRNQNRNATFQGLRVPRRIQAAVSPFTMPGFGKKNN